MKPIQLKNRKNQSSLPVSEFFVFDFLTTCKSILKVYASEEQSIPKYSMKKFARPNLIILFAAFSYSSGKEPSSLKVYDAIINPVLEAKCVSCHGAEKNKGKLRMHNKESLIQGGRGAGDAIIVKGDVEESELIYRLTLPKDDEEAMPPTDDESHYNPVTIEELSVLKSWINLGASFDMMVNDLDQAGKKAAEHVLENLPVKKLSATALLIPKLPEVSPADSNVIENLRKNGILVMPIAQNTNALYVNASYNGKSFTDDSIALLQPIAPQLLWLNVARTSITDKSSKSIANFSLLERLHAENTFLTDAATPNISKLSNLKYLNLYGTGISDASIENFRKLRKLEKVFLWQTKVTPAGAESLRKNFVDPKIYAHLANEKSALIAKIKDISETHDQELEKFNTKITQLSAKTEDTSPINDKCPVSNKSIDETTFINFEGRMIGLCCGNCKTKFGKDPSSYRSKISNFVPSKNFENTMKAIISLETEKSGALDKVSTKLREVTSKLNSMGPQINLGWSIAQTNK